MVDQVRQSVSDGLEEMDVGVQVHQGPSCMSPSPTIEWSGRAGANIRLPDEKKAQERELEVADLQTNERLQNDGRPL